MNIQKTKRILQFLLIIYAFVIVSIVFMGQLSLAAKKPLWLDEKYGLKECQSQTYGSFLIHGAISEPSPAPLDFLTNKLFIDLKPFVQSFGLTDEQYFRIKPILIVIGGFLLVVATLMLLNSTLSWPSLGLQFFLLCCIPFAYFLETQIFFYTIEARSYALWVALYAWVLISTFKFNSNPWLLLISMSLMAATSIASVYQISIILGVMFCLMLLDRLPIGLIVRRMRIFVIPLVIAMYYCYLSGTGYLDRVATGGTWEQFWDFWTNKLTTVPLMIVASLLALLSKETRIYAIAPISYLIYYLLGPFIFYLTTHVRGYFYAERQFICYDLTMVVFISTLYVVLPHYLNRMKYVLSWIVVLIVCVTVVSLTFRSKKMHKWQDIIEACLPSINK